MFAPNCPYSFLHEELRQPLCIVFEYLQDPTPCRNSCTFFRQCFDSAVRNEFLGEEGDEELKLTTCFPQSKNRTVVRDILSSSILLSTPFRTLAISSLELADLPNLRAVDHDLLRGSRTLTSVTLARLPQLAVIGRNFAAFCPTLEMCLMSDLPFLEEIHEQMLYKSGVRHLWIENLPKLRLIGPRVVAESPRLRTIRLQNLKSLRVVGSYFASGCSVLERIRLIGLPNLQEISSHFGENTAILQMDIEELPRLRIIRSHFAASSSMMTQVTFKDLPELKIIEHAALEDCPLLQKVYFCNLPLLVDLCGSDEGYDKASFASSCPRLLTSEGSVVVGRRKSYARETVDHMLQTNGEAIALNFSRVIQWFDGRLRCCPTHLAKRPIATETVDRTRAAGLGFHSRRLPGGVLVVEDNIVSTLTPGVRRRAGAIDDTGCGCNLM